MLRQGKKDLLKWIVYENREKMGAAAAEAVGNHIKKLLAEKATVNIILASAPSQNDLFSSLKRIPGIDWSRVNAFHMDEYIGLGADSPQSFSYYLKKHFFDVIKPREFFCLNGLADPEEEAKRYSQLLAEYPVDICCLGIGENGHLAFNDPHVADFNDPVAVKTVSIDDTSRMQQVHDGAFARVEDVPRLALTLTLPALLKAQFVTAVVPGPTKAKAVARTLNGPIDEECPATILRRHPNAILYLDPDSASLLEE